MTVERYRCWVRILPPLLRTACGFLTMTTPCPAKSRARGPDTDAHPVPRGNVDIARRA